MDTQRTRRILTLGLPIVGGMASQNVLNLVDTAMVGALGTTALAAVGMASFATFLSQAFVTGFGSGVQAMASRRVGEGRGDEAAVPLNGGLAWTLGLGAVLAVSLYPLVPTLFPLLQDDPTVAELGTSYWRWRLFGIPAVAANFAFRGYWNGVGRSTIYLRTLVVMHAANLLFNYLFIFGSWGAPEMGADGAALGTSLALWIGTLLYAAQGWTLAREQGFMQRWPDADSLRTLFRLGLPSGVQQLLFAAGFTSLFVVVGQVGVAELGVANVLLNLSLVAVLPAMGLGLAASTLVGQALGRGDVQDARRWGWEVAQLAGGALLVLGLAAASAPGWVLSWFLHEPAAVALGLVPLRLTGVSIALDGIGLVLMNAMLGAGDNRRALAVSVGLQWGVGLGLAVLLGPVLGLGLTGVWLSQVVYRALMAATFAALWRGDGWARIKV